MVVGLNYYLLIGIFYFSKVVPNMITITEINKSMRKVLICSSVQDTWWLVAQRAKEIEKQNTY